MIKKKRKNLISDKENPYLQVEKICLYADKLRKITYKKTKIKSNYVFSQILRLYLRETYYIHNSY